MAFVNKRRKKDTGNIEDTKIQVSKTNETDSREKFNIKRKTYLDMTIEVLNTLDSQGIDVFDKSRFGGMYQVRGYSNQLKIKNLTNNINNLVTQTQKQPNTQQENNDNNPPINSLLNFIKQKTDK